MAITAAYRYNGNTNDLVGSNNGTLNNSPAVGPRMGLGGGSYTFSGSGASGKWISHASAWHGAVSVYTYSWLQMRTSDTGTINATGCNYFSAAYRSGTGLSEVRDYNGSVEPVVTTTVTKDVVHQIHAVLTGGNLKMYVDGVYKGQAAMSGNCATTSRGNEIGAYNNSAYQQWFIGSIGSFKHYNSALSAAEIKNDYIYHKGFF